MKFPRLLLDFYHRHAIPLILLAVTGLAYGWQVSWLGFYWDDWVFISRFHTLGIFNTIFYGGTRQLGVFALMPGFLLAGDSPLLWHLYSMLLRWCVALLFWWALDKLWPGQKTSVTLMAALFAVHPAFSQQSIAVVYSLQFVNYAIFLISFGAMVNAGRIENQPRKRWLWLGLALTTQALHLFVVEYFFGLELIRPLALYLIQESKRSGWQGRLRRIKFALVQWLPYVLVLAVYIVWRSGALGGGFATYDYKTITALLRSDPRGAFVETLEYGLKDILMLLVNTWQGTLAPSIIDLSQPYNFFSLGMAALIALGLYHVLSRPSFDPANSTQQDNSSFGEGRFLWQAAALGFLAVLVSFIPAWFVRRHIVEPGNFGDRFALAGLFGASILLVAFSRFFGGRRDRGILLAALFIGLAVGAQIRFANNYRWDWERQLRTYWQVFWRAPSLQPGTVLVGYEAISSTTVNYVGAFAFNELYGQHSTMPGLGGLGNWYVNYPKTPIAANMDKFLAGDWSYVDEFDNISAPVGHDNSLGLDYGEGRCVRILTPDDLTNYSLADDFRPAARFSNPALVLPKTDKAPSARIFGRAPQATWCYYFQKAELARQTGDWDEIIRLQKEADNHGFEALNAYELLPFVEAYAMRADWPIAQKLSLQAYKSLPKTQAGLCLVWKRVGQDNPEGYEAAFEQVNSQLACR